MSSTLLAHGVGEHLCLFDADLRATNSIASKAASIVTIESLTAYQVQEHLIK